MSKWIAFGCVAIAALLAAAAAPAQTPDGGAAPAPVEKLAPVEPGQSDAPAAPAAADAAAPAAPAGPDGAATEVWWGNRSISYGNYIKFDKYACHPKCEHCDQNMNDCETGCPCESCVHICADCNDCPPTAFEKIFFDLDKSVLRPKSIEECQKVLVYLNNNPNKHILIEGHCCDLASDPYNVGLGQRRADAVQKWLIEHGIDAGRITTRTFGERQPWVGVQQRELNRRAIVVVVQ